MDPNQLKIVTLEENPERHEQVICAQQLDIDPDIRKLLESTYLEADRVQAFERFRAGYEFQTILALFDIFGVGRDEKLCEVGGGSGFFPGP